MKKLLAKATTLYEKDRYRQAMTVARKVLELDPKNESAMFYVAHGLYYAKQYRRSLQYWRKLQKYSPTEPNLHLNMGACYDDLGNVALAVKYYHRELQLNPVCGPALYNLGALYFGAHKYKQASGYFERCFSQGHSMEAIVCRLAWSYFKTGQLQKEQLLYEDWLQTHPDDTWALNNLGSHLMGQGAYHRALLRLKKAARLDPKDKLVAKNIRKAERMLREQDNFPS